MKGDMKKAKCIRNYSKSFRGDFIVENRTFKEGRYYDFRDEDNNLCWVITDDNNGLRFVYDDKSYGNCDPFSQYFIDVAKERNRNISIILTGEE